MSLRRKFKSERELLVDNDKVRCSKEKFGHKKLQHPQPVETARTSQRNVSKDSDAHLDEDFSKKCFINLMFM